MEQGNEGEGPARPFFHLVGTTKEKASEVDQDGPCPDCGGKLFEPDYGRCVYGIGIFQYCSGCFAIFNFWEDPF